MLEKLDKLHKEGDVFSMLDLVRYAFNSEQVWAELGAYVFAFNHVKISHESGDLFSCPFCGQPDCWDRADVAVDKETGREDVSCPLAYFISQLAEVLCIKPRQALYVALGFQLLLRHPAALQAPLGIMKRTASELPDIDLSVAVAADICTFEHYTEFREKNFKNLAKTVRDKALYGDAAIHDLTEDEVRHLLASGRPA